MLSFPLRGSSISSLPASFFAIACTGHYNAFAKGQIRLVVPLIGIFSVAAFIIATIVGSPISLGQSMAVIVLVIGIGLLARSDA